MSDDLNQPDQPLPFDVFVSHASEDKAGFVEPLVEALASRGIRVWYDSREITLGDDFRKKIDEGLAQSRYAVVVVSPSFRKFWPEAELDAFRAALELQRSAPPGGMARHRVDRGRLRRPRHDEARHLRR